jgi:hypothetical protein
VLALVTAVSAQCGSGSPDGTVTGEGNFVATVAGAEVYSGDNYYTAIQTALDSLTAGQRLSVIASGNIGPAAVVIPSGITFEGCGTIDTHAESGRGGIEITNVADVSVPYLTLTGAPYFAMRIFGATNLNLGEITMNLSGGLGIRFERDEPPSSGVTMGTISVTGAGSHAVETWNIDGLAIGSVIARDVGECGLLLQEVTNAEVGLVDGDNVAAGNGYATLRFANNNGQLADGSYTTTNIFIEQVISRGGGRGIFCVSQSGAARINSIDLADNGNNAILIENCYNLSIESGVVNGGGDVRLSARDEFPNNSGIFLGIEVNDNNVVENPCGENIGWNLSGNHNLNIC